MEQSQFISLVDSNQLERVVESVQQQQSLGPLAYTRGYGNSEAKQGGVIQIQPVSAADLSSTPPVLQFEKTFGSDDQGVIGVTRLNVENCDQGSCGLLPQ